MICASCPTTHTKHMTQYFNSIPPKYQSILTRLGYLILILTPIIFTMALLSIRHNITYWDLSPLWTDEAHYWHQAKTFATVGLNSNMGAYSVLEQLSPVPFAHYFAWGVTIPAFYGTIARFFGLFPVSFPLIHLAMMTLALVTYVFYVRPRLWQSLILAIALALYPPYLLYFPTTIIEVGLIAIAIMFASGLIYMLKQDTEWKRRDWVIFFTFFIIISTMRLSFSIFAPMIMLFILRHRPWWMRGIGFLGGGAIVGLIFLWHRWTSAPWPYELPPEEIISAFLQSGFDAGLRLWWQKIEFNLQQFTQGDILEQGARWVAVGIVTISSLGWITVFILRRWFDISKRWLWEFGFYVWHTGIVLALLILLYSVHEWGSFRWLSIHNAITLVMFIGLRKRWWIAILALIPMFVAVEDTFKIHDIWTGFHVNPDRPAQYEQWTNDLEDILIYDANASSPWCNTVNHTVYYLFNQVPLLMAIDGGMGLSSHLFQTEFPLPFKSKYLLLDTEFYTQIENQIRVEHIRDMPNGALYLNLDTACEN